VLGSYGAGDKLAIRARWASCSRRGALTLGAGGAASRIRLHLCHERGVGWAGVGAFGFQSLRALGEKRTYANTSGRISLEVKPQLIHDSTSTSMVIWGRVCFQGARSMRLAPALWCASLVAAENRTSGLIFWPSISGGPRVALWRLYVLLRLSQVVKKTSKGVSVWIILVKVTVRKPPRASVLKSGAGSPLASMGSSTLQCFVIMFHPRAFAAASWAAVLPHQAGREDME